MSFLACTQSNLNRFIPGYAGLNPTEKKRINEFSLVWQMFEGRIFNHHATGHLIIEGNWIFQDAEHICTGAASSISYFRDRYSIGGNAEERLNSLLGQQVGNMRQKMQQCITQGFDVEANQEDIVRSCGAICFRLRNNLFHGGKAAYGFADQRLNFTHGVRFLNTCLNVLV